jgi:hypothetical protein
MLRFGKFAALFTPAVNGWKAININPHLLIAEMENCTLYSHQIGFDKIVRIVESSLPTAHIDHKDGGLQQSLTATIKGGFFSKSKTLKISYRQRQNPSYKLDKIDCELTQNLAGMVNFIQSLPAKNEEIKGRFLYKGVRLQFDVDLG